MNTLPYCSVCRYLIMIWLLLTSKNNVIRSRYPALCLFAYIIIYTTDNCSVACINL